MTTYCAPCLADLALVREATTAVGGTASCMAHAVLLTHPTDDPQRRRQRLAQLRQTANDKLDTVGEQERMRLEILVEEYSLASAMESLVPRRRLDGVRPAERLGERPGPRPGDSETSLSRSARKRRARENRDRTGPAGGPVTAVPAGVELPAAGEHPTQEVPVGEPAAEQSLAPSGAPESGPGQADGSPDAVAGDGGRHGVAAPGGSGADEVGGNTVPEAVGGPDAGSDAVTGGGAEQLGAQALEQVGAPAGEPTAPADPPSPPAPADPPSPPAPADAVSPDGGSGGSAVGATAHDQT